MDALACESKRTSNRNVPHIFSPAVALGAAGILAASLVISASALPPITTCTLEFTTGWPCPFCGLTRAFCAIGHGQFDLAWRLHPLSFALYAVFIAVALSPLWRRAAPGFAQGLERILLSRTAIIAASALFLCVWILRVSLGWWGGAAL